MAVPLAIFDLDGTLVDQESAAREWAQGFAETWLLSARDGEGIALALAARRPKGEVFAELVQSFELPVASAVVWDDYRARMERERRVLIRIQPERAGPDRQG